MIELFDEERDDDSADEPEERADSAVDDGPLHISRGDGFGHAEGDGDQNAAGGIKADVAKERAKSIVLDEIFFLRVAFFGGELFVVVPLIPGIIFSTAIDLGKLDLVVKIVRRWLKFLATWQTSSPLPQ